MAQLEGVLRMIEARRVAKNPDPPTIVETRFMPNFPYDVDPSGSAYLDRMISLMNVSELSVKEITEGFISLAAGMVEMDSQITTMREDVNSAVQGMAEMRQSIAEVTSRVDRFRDDMATLVQAIRSIKLPDVNIPPQKDPDLSPITSSIDNLRMMLDDTRMMVAMLDREDPEEPEVEEVEKVEDPPEEWVFEVKRNQAGLIRTVEVKEVRT